MAKRKAASEDEVALVEPEAVEYSILVIRGHKVLIDEQLAAFYDAPTKAIVQAVKRNIERFPDDFMFQLTDEEWSSLRSQIVTSNVEGRGGRRYAPYAFTEQGVAILFSLVVAVANRAAVFSKMPSHHRHLRELNHAFDRIEAGHAKRTLSVGIEIDITPHGHDRQFGSSQVISQRGIFLDQFEKLSSRLDKLQFQVGHQSFCAGVVGHRLMIEQLFRELNRCIDRGHSVWHTDSKGLRSLVWTIQASSNLFDDFVDLIRLEFRRLVL